VRDGEPPSVASRSRRGPERHGVYANVVHTDIVYADECTAESIELKPKEVDDVEDKVVEVFFSELSEQPSE
jgi:hypothetical protein